MLLWQEQCDLCGALLPSDSEMPIICAACQLRYKSSFIAGSLNGTALLSLYDYHKRGAFIIRRYKLSYRRNLARFLAQELSRNLKQAGMSSRTLIAVPSHRRFFWERRAPFSSTAEVLRILGRYYGFHIRQGALRSHGHREQKRLSAAQRRRAVKGRFSLIRPLTPGQYILFDDVVTTGSTMKACIDVLKKSGITDIIAVSLSRA